MGLHNQRRGTFCRELGHNRRNCRERQKYVDAGRKGGAAGTEAQNEARRINGAKSLGPEIKHRYHELFEDLEEPPEDPGELTGWVQRIAATCLRETLQGRGNAALNDEVRKIGHTISELVPRERLFKAERLIRKDRDRLKAKPKASGPATQKARPSEGPVR